MVHMSLRCFERRCLKRSGLSLKAGDFRLDAVHPKLDPGPGIDRGGVTGSECGGTKERPHGYFLFELKTAERREATNAPSEPLAGLENEGEPDAGGFSDEIGAGGETPMGGIFPSKLTVRSSAMIASSKPAHPG